MLGALGVVSAIGGLGGSRGGSGGLAGTTGTIPQNSGVGSAGGLGFDIGGLMDSIGSIANQLICTGSLYSSDDLQTWVSVDIAKMYSETVGSGLTESSIATYMDLLNWTYTQARQYGGKMRSCSQKALYGFADAANKAKQEFINYLRQNGYKQIKSVTVPKNTPLPFTFTDHNFNAYDKSYQSERFEKESVISGIGDIFTENTGTALNPQGKTLKAGFSWLGALIFGGLVVKALKDRFNKNKDNR